MPYPIAPKNKQYDTWFPDIEARSVPAPKDSSTVESSPVSMHGSGGEKRSETLSGPKKLEMGALRLWIEGGGRKSKSFDDGPSFDYGGHKVKKVEEGEDGMNFAPGTDEKALNICWEVFGLPNIKSAKLELFCKGNFKPIWEHHYGNGWGKQKEAIDAFAKITKASGVTAVGELPFSNVKVDTAAKVKDETGHEETAFPKGLLTVACSPYQLRLTVSGCTADKTPADGNDFVYPMTAWTYLHVLVDSFQFKFGDPKWLAATRDDIDDEFKEQILGKGGKPGLEAEILDELRGFVKGEDGRENMQDGIQHAVPLRTAYNKNWNRVDHEVHGKMWSLGARVPIVATGRIKTLAGKPTDEKAADVMWNARLMWDWEEPSAKRLETITKATKTLHDGAPDLEFLKRTTKESSEKNFPKGSFNCPVELGGKHGSDDPFFLPQTTKGNGNGSPPYEIKPMATRSWAVVSRFDDKGETGVVMFPSRFAGDAYKVKVYLFREGLDTRDAIKEPDTAIGSPGAFFVYRRIKVHHLVFGDLPGIDLKKMQEDVVTAADNQAYVHIEFVTTKYTGQPYIELCKEVRKNLILETTFPMTMAYHGLELPHFLDLSSSPGSALMKVSAQQAFGDAIERVFKQGAIRAVKNDLKLLSENLGMSDTVTGSKNGSTGCLLDLGDTFGTEKVAYAISNPGQPAFTDGENATSVATGKAKKLTFAVPYGSAWEVKFTPVQDATIGKSVKVTLPGQKPVLLEFKRATFGREVASTLTDKMKGDLQASFDKAVTALADAQTFEMKIAGDQGESPAAKRRLESVQKHLETLCATRLIVRSKILSQFKLKGGTSALATMEPKAYAETINDEIYSTFIEAAVFSHVVKEKLTEGVVVIQASRPSSASDHDDKVKDYDHGGFLSTASDKKDDQQKKDTKGLHKKDYEKIGLVYLVTPDRNADTYLFKGTGKVPKSPWAVLLHELGHSQWLEHVTASRPGQPRAASPQPSQHVKGGVCLMSYDRDTNQYCALCMLRLRGWNWSGLKSNDPYPKLKLELRPGDIDAIFPDWGDTVEGKQMRLQTLGLFNRPMRHATEEFDTFKREFWECWDYSWKLAKTMFPGIEHDGFGTVLNDAIKKFVVEDGKLPKPGEQAKFRVSGHYAPFYANMDVAMRYGNATEKGSRENQFKMLAIRGDVEALFQGGNPGIGAYPIEVVVTDEAGEAMPGAEVWVHLVKPDAPEAWDENFAGKKVLGATTYIKGTGAAPISGTPQHEHIGKWFKANVATFEPGADSDPQSGNVHFKMGGKRRMTADLEDLGTPAPSGLRNVFSPDPQSGATEIKQAVAGGGGAVKSAVSVIADDEGIARFLFTPSTVGGDRYKLKVTARNPFDKLEVGSAETGTFVVWKSHRVAGYYQVTNAADQNGIAQYMQEWVKRFYSGRNIYGPLTPIDLRRTVGDELARAYCEVFFEDEALRPTPIDQAYWTRFHEWVNKLAPLYNVEDYQMYFNGKGSRVAMTHAGGKTWTATIPSRVRKGCVGIWMMPPGTHFDMTSLLGHIDQTAADTVTKPKIVPLKSGDWIFGLDQANAPSQGLFTMMGSKYKAAGASVQIDDATSSFDYATGSLTVTFKTDPTPGAPTYVSPASKWGDLIEVTGATLANTDDGKLYITVRSSKLAGTWNTYFYKSPLKRDADMVAKAKRNRAGSTCRARAQNNSGLSIRFKMGTGLEDGQNNVMSAGIPVLYAVFFPEKMVDLDVVVEDVTQSPWLLNYLPWQEYNRRKGAAYPDAEPASGSERTSFENVAGEKADYSWAETIFMRALSASLRDQGFGYYPGQFYIQANFFNPVQAAGLAGKGVGNTALIFNEGVTHPPKMHYTVLHETGHCLYGVHAYNEHSGAKPNFHDPDFSKYTCIMGAPEDLNAPFRARPKDDEPNMSKKQIARAQADWDEEKKERDKGTFSIAGFCGKCNAGLRGLLVMQDPLYKDKTNVGNADQARTPSLGTGTGGIVLPDPDPDPHLIPLPGEDEDLDLLDLSEVEKDVEDNVEVDNMFFSPQAKSNWCWAAASLMMRRYFKDEQISQCQLASEALFDDGTDCCDKKHDARCNVEHALALIDLEHDSSGEGTELSFQQIKDEIDNNRPFIVARAKHYLVCYGYAESDQTEHVLLFDPLPVGVGSKRKITYDDYKKYIAESVALATGGTGKGANYYNFKVKGAAKKT